MAGFFHHLFADHDWTSWVPNSAYSKSPSQGVRIVAFDRICRDCDTQQWKFDRYKDGQLVKSEIVDQ